MDFSKILNVIFSLLMKKLLLALFRIIEPVSGSIYIDSVDITKVGLHDCKLFIIYLNG
jgi:ABC-type bacteriocin/lantibiotic exporter with double-glycine peptidase domain